MITECGSGITDETQVSIVCISVCSAEVKYKSVFIFRLVCTRPFFSKIVKHMINPPQVCFCFVFYFSDSAVHSTYSWQHSSLIVHDKQRLFSTLFSNDGSHICNIQRSFSSPPYDACDIDLQSGFLNHFFSKSEPDSMVKLARADELGKTAHFSVSAPFLILSDKRSFPIA